MTLKDAYLVARKLTEMSTTGEDFLAGERNGIIIIERWDDMDSYAMSIEEAIQYANVFIGDAKKKIELAANFLATQTEDGFIVTKRKENVTAAWLAQDHVRVTIRDLKYEGPITSISNNGFELDHRWEFGWEKAGTFQYIEVDNEQIRKATTCTGLL